MCLEDIMCTAISYKNGDAYFGRNLDLERGYGEQVVITPRRYPIPMRHTKPMERHHAMIGMAAVVEGYPLYFDATNEKGLSMAGLHFPGNAVYHLCAADKENIAPFEFIPWVLGQCRSVGEVKRLMEKVNLVNVNFSPRLPVSPLHWMVSDRESSIVIESLKDGLAVYDDPFNVLTNNPPFPYHQINMSNYMGLGTGPAPTQFRGALPLENYSLGMGAIGLPGDFSSASRFVRAVFVKENSVSAQNEKSNVNQFFHILNSVAMPKGCVWTENGFEYTRYSSCCNANKGIYYYTTYQNLNVRSVSMHNVDLEQSCLYAYGEICDE